MRQTFLPVLLSALLVPVASASAEKVTSAVSSGNVAEMDRYPAVGRLEEYLPDFKGGERRQGFCSGTLISSRYVLTAAHCVSGVPGESQEYLQKARPRVKFLNKQGAPAIPIRRIAYFGPYAEYNDFSSLDIALLELVWDASIEPMQIATMPSGGGQLMRVLGYGQYRKKLGMSNLLRYGSNVSAADPGKCVSAMKGNIKMHDYQICTVVDLPRGYDSQGCPGDSGGPLLNAADQVVGVTSFGQYFNCEVKPGKRSGVYARVSSGVDWIRRQTGLSFLGLPALSQDLTAPLGSKVDIVSVSARRVQLAARAEGSDWKGSLRVTVSGLRRSGSSATNTYEAIVTPEDNDLTIELPRSYRSKRVSSVYVSASGRFWNAIDNGSSALAEAEITRPYGPVRRTPVDSAVLWPASLVR